MISDSSRNLAYAAYIPIAGWLVALLVRRVTNDISPFTTFHLRQGLGLLLLEILCYLIFLKLIALTWLWYIVQIFLFLFILVGLRSVYRSRQTYQPLLGRLYDRLFTFIGQTL